MIPLAHRALAAFAAPLPVDLAPLSAVYGVSGKAKLVAITERATLARELHDLESDDDVDAGSVLVSLQRRREIHRRLEELERVIAVEGAKEQTAVELAEAVRSSGVVFPSPSLTASSTHDATMAGIRGGIATIDEPLTDADRERIQRRRR